jgi:hypothetical protein
VHDSAVQLRATGGVVLSDATLGAIHIQKGVVDAHFMVCMIIVEKYFCGSIYILNFLIS